MVTPFETAPDDSRLWIFPSSRKFYPQELEKISDSISVFLNQWKSAEHPIESGFQIKYDRFIMIVALEGQNSLSLEAHDALSSFILTLEKQLSVTLLDKINICYKQGEFVQYKESADFKKMIKNRSVSKNTIVFDNMISTKGQLNFDWEVYLSESWLSHLL